MKVGVCTQYHTKRQKQIQDMYESLTYPPDSLVQCVAPRRMTIVLQPPSLSTRVETAPIGASCLRLAEQAEASFRCVGITALAIGGGDFWKNCPIRRAVIPTKILICMLLSRLFHQVFWEMINFSQYVACLQICFLRVRRSTETRDWLSFEDYKHKCWNMQFTVK